MSDIIITFLFLIFFAVILFCAAFMAFSFISIIKGAPYVPTKRKAVDKMINFAGVKTGEKSVDIGSGDGRIVIAMAKRGAVACGYEINPILAWWSRREIRKAGLENKAFIHVKNIWSQNFSSFNIVTVFGMPKIMKELGQKLGKELKPGTKIISYGFRFPDWQPVKKEDGVFLYEKK